MALWVRRTISVRIFSQVADSSPLVKVLTDFMTWIRGTSAQGQVLPGTYLAMAEQPYVEDTRSPMMLLTLPPLLLRIALLVRERAPLLSPILDSSLLSRSTIRRAPVGSPEIPTNSFIPPRSRAYSLYWMGRCF